MAHAARERGWLSRDSAGAPIPRQRRPWPGARSVSEFATPRIPGVVPATQGGLGAGILRAGNPLSAEWAATVLVADDDPTARRVLVRILESAGYTVIQATDGSSARRLVASAS